MLSILLTPPPLGSGVPVATRGASLPIAGALPARTERLRYPVAQGRNVALSSGPVVRQVLGHPGWRPRSCSSAAEHLLLCDFCVAFPSPSSRLSSPSHVSRTFGPDSSSERKGGHGPGECGDGALSLFPGSAGHCGKKGKNAEG